MTLKYSSPWPLACVLAFAAACGDDSRPSSSDGAVDTAVDQAPADAAGDTGPDRAAPVEDGGGKDQSQVPGDGGGGGGGDVAVGTDAGSVGVDARLDGAADAWVDVAGTHLDAPGRDGAVDGQRQDAVPVDGGVDSFSSGIVRFCAGKSAPVGTNLCRRTADCGPTGPVVCSVGPYDWGPAACPLPPSSQPCPSECTTDTDCTDRPGGRCSPFTRTCPRCDGRVCNYPIPRCTTSPDSCGSGQRCGADGACGPIPCSDGNACATGYRCNVGGANADRQGCEPIPCDQGTSCAAGLRCSPGGAGADAFGCVPILCSEGYACPAGSRCNVGDARADRRGCEVIPCGDAFVCPENMRCSEAAPAPGSHGCTTTSCTTDGDCDCGYCVGGKCSADPGTCQFAPA